MTPSFYWCAAHATERTLLRDMLRWDRRQTGNASWRVSSSIMQNGRDGRMDTGRMRYREVRTRQALYTRPNNEKRKVVNALHRYYYRATLRVASAVYAVVACL